MSTYYNRRPRERLPSITNSFVVQPIAPDAHPSAILIFPSPSSAPPSPSSLLSSPTPPELSRQSTSAVSLPTSLVASVEGRSSHSRSDSGWEDIIAEVHSASRRVDDSGRPYYGPEPLTRDRVALLGSAQGIPWELEDGSVDDVEIWDWSGGETPSVATTPDIGGLVHRRPLSGNWEVDTQYESASSQLHFSTTASSHANSEADADFGSLFLLTLKSRDDNNHNNATIIQPSSTPRSRTFHLPFESILRFFFDIDPATLDLLKQPNTPPRPHPLSLNPSQSALFPTRLIPEDAAASEIESEKEALREHDTYRLLSFFSSDTREALQSLRKGLDVSARAPSLMDAARVPILMLKVVPKAFKWAF